MLCCGVTGSPLLGGIGREPRAVIWVGRVTSGLQSPALGFDNFTQTLKHPAFNEYRGTQTQVLMLAVMFAD